MTELNDRIYVVDRRDYDRLQALAAQLHTGCPQSLSGDAVAFCYPTNTQLAIAEVRQRGGDATQYTTQKFLGENSGVVGFVSRVRCWTADSIDAYLDWLAVRGLLTPQARDRKARGETAAQVVEKLAAEAERNVAEQTRLNAAAARVAENVVGQKVSYASN